MTVRWRPLIVLSGLFLMIAVSGLLAVTLDLGPGDAEGILASARQQWKDGRYADAQIHFQRALQKAPKDAAIHAELARMLGEWGAQSKDPGTRARLRAERLSALADAAKYGKEPAPRRALLADALAREDLIQADLWARKLLDLDANDPDAHFALATAALSAEPADIETATRDLKALDNREPQRVRTEWVRAQLARSTGDDATLQAVLDRQRGATLPAEADLTDRVARLGLLQLDALSTQTPAELLERTRAVTAEADAQVAAPTTTPDRATTIARLLDDLQRHLSTVAVAHPDQAEVLTQAGDELDRVVESAFQGALKATGSANLAIARDYAEHLLFRDDRARCLELIEQTLALPVASKPQWSDVTTRLREVAIKAALLGVDDPDRLSRAEVHIKALIGATDATHRAIGHLFQGVIELERSGLTAGAAGASAGMDANAQAALRSSALGHLKRAAAGLPQAATAQALYGVALLLTGEPALGRQYLAAARKLPRLEPRYQVWSAWAMLQAGYPEEAEPIVAELAAEARSGNLPEDLLPTLHLLTGEIHQARRTPEDLEKAREAYEAALAAGGPDTPALQLRLVQIEILAGRTAEGLARIQKIRAEGGGGPEAEHLAVLILSDAGRAEEARKVLDAARAVYPSSSALAGLDAALWLQADQTERADEILARFLEDHPDDLDAIQMRARLLADARNQPDEARALLAEAAERADSSAPLVQLALLDLGRGDQAAVNATITSIRDRWPEAAAADLLDAQLAMSQENPRAALVHLQDALKKDPSNKLALFWKAQLDDRSGESDEAARIYESIVQANPTKELDDGLSLATAAQWSLANLALENRQVDTAIARLEDLLRGGVSGDRARPVRWQLAAARATKGEWPAARAEIEDLLSDPRTRADERVRAANLYRLHGEPERAVALLDEVLVENPAESSAVAIRAFLLAESEPAQAATLVRKAIAAGEQPATIYLMLAAIENMTPPVENGLERARKALDEGLKVHPGSVELVQAYHRVLTLDGAADEALAFVQRKAQDDPSGDFRRLLVHLHRAEGRLDEAETVTRGLLKDLPEDRELALMLVGLTALRAEAAEQRGDAKAGQSLSTEVAELIRRFRAQFPDDVSFPQLECELAARSGDLDRALAIAREIDTMAPTSPVGPTLRAQIAAARGWSEGVAREYTEAVNRSPRRADLRLALGQAHLALGQPDPAQEQADWLLQQNAGDLAALLLKARALAHNAGSPDQTRARRQEAIQLLSAALEDRPTFAAAYHLIAEIQLLDGNRAGAAETLRQGLKAVPNDAAGLGQLVQTLSTPVPDGTPPSPAELQDASAWADRLAGPDASGEMALSVSIGFHRAGRFDLALPWAQKAVERLGTWVAHLNHADLLLAQAEGATDSQTARDLFEQAVAQYDRVLQDRPGTVEAINNKAWILHQYLDRHAEALTLAEGLLKRADASTLPPDFFDTLGSIQESLNRAKDAEDAYTEGLRRAADHPILNYHMGRLLAANAERASGALPYLKKAQAGRDGLPPAMAAEIDELLAQVTR